MKQKNLSYLSFLLIFSTICIQANQYHEYAQSWVEEHLLDQTGNLCIDSNELQAITELVQISYERSKNMLIAQGAALTAATQTWQLYHNVASRRLNPSHVHPYSINKETHKKITHDFWHSYDAQEASCKAYKEIVSNVVYGTVLQSEKAQEAVKQLRSQARVYMLDALTDVKTHLGVLYEIAFSKSANIDEAPTRFGLQSISQFILSYIPNLAIHTFIDADKLHTTMSREGWDVLHKVQEVGNQVWHAIETARSDFYQALLNQLESIHTP